MKIIDMESPKKSQLTRQRVLSVTSELFRTKGYKATSMRDIAAAVGMKSGSLYYYYDSKEALLAAILNDNIDATISNLQEAVAALPANATVHEKFNAAVKSAIMGVASSGDMAIASVKTLSYLQEPEYSEQLRHRQAYKKFWRDLIKEGKESGEIDSSLHDAFICMAIIGSITFITEWYEPKRASLETVGDIFSQFFFNGLRGPR